VSQGLYIFFCVDNQIQLFFIPAVANATDSSDLNELSFFIYFFVLFDRIVVVFYIQHIVFFVVVVLTFSLTQVIRQNHIFVLLNHACVQSFFGAGVQNGA